MTTELRLRTMDLDLAKITDLTKIEEVAAALMKSADECTDVDTRAKIEMDLGEAISYYGEVSKNDFYTAASKSGDRMMYAVKTIFYDTIRLHDLKDPVTHLVTGRELIHSAQPVDLDRMNAHYDGIGADKIWRSELSEFSWELNLALAAEIGAADAVSMLNRYRGNFYADKLAKDVGLGKNPVSKTKILLSTRRIVGHMIGAEWESKVLSKHVAFIKGAYSKAAPKTVAGLDVLTSKGMCGVLRQVCSMIVLGVDPTIKSRDLDRAIKEAAKAASKEAVKAEPKAEQKPESEQK